jgi:hypothetical protein
VISLFWESDPLGGERLKKPVKGIGGKNSQETAENSSVNIKIRGNFINSLEWNLLGE